MKVNTATLSVNTLNLVFRFTHVPEALVGRYHFSIELKLSNVISIWSVEVVKAIMGVEKVF